MDQGELAPQRGRLPKHRIGERIREHAPEQLSLNRAQMAKEQEMQPPTFGGPLQQSFCRLSIEKPCHDDVAQSLEITDQDILYFPLAIDDHI